MLKKTIIGIAVTLLLAGATTFLATTNIFLELNGQSPVDVEVFSEYVDQGAKTRFGSGEITTDSNVDTSKLGSYTITYKWLMASAKRVVNVVDTTAPEIILNSGSDINWYMLDEYNEPGWQVNDNYDTDLNDKVTVTGSVDPNVAGDYTLTYEVSDNSGNKTTVQRTVHVLEDTYKYEGTINNKANIDEDMVNLIVDFYNNYYRTMKYLEVKDASQYFSSNEQAYMFNLAQKFLVETRKKSINDLTLDDCSYDLNIKSSKLTDGVYKVVVWENSNLNFHFLNGLTSKLADIENTFYIKKVDGEYKISKLYKEENFFLVFYNNYSSTSDYQSALDKIYDKYMGYVENNTVEYEAARQSVINGETISMSVKKAYDRNSAVEYAQKYWHTRNKPAYFALSSNCMNFGSQCMFAGGIPMDITGTAQWKYYGSSYNANQTKSGYVYAWTSMSYFRNYIKNNTGSGMVAKLLNNLYLAEPGDMIQVGYNSATKLNHNMICVDLVKNSSGEVIDILCNGNTIDMQNYPLSASVYPFKVCIKIFGSN